MAKRPKSICRQPACGALLDAPGYCSKHQKAASAYNDRFRASASERGYDSKWAKARLVWLSSNPLCVHCKRDGRTIVATVVDHVIPHKLKDAIHSDNAERIAKAQYLFWWQGNWQSLCKMHHDVKTATEDGGFGRKGN